MSNSVMSLKNRDDLEKLFKNRTRLSEDQFAELIYSTLNRREDQFHGVWKPQQTYRKGDVVYYQGALWEMQVAEICSKPDQEPGTGSDWKSLLKELEQKVDQLQKKLDQLCKEFSEYQQKMEQRLYQLARYIFALILGSAIILVWLASATTHHFLGGS